MSGEHSPALQTLLGIVPAPPALGGWPVQACAGRIWLFSAHVASNILNTINLQTILYKAGEAMSWIVSACADIHQKHLAKALQ